MEDRAHDNSTCRQWNKFYSAMYPITTEANQIFRELSGFDHGSSKRKSVNYIPWTRRSDGREVFDVKE